MKLKIMTYNIQHGHVHLGEYGAGIGDDIDLTKVGEVMRECGADVIGLNEVRGNGERADYTAQAEFLANYLGYHCYFGSSCYVRGGGYYGNAIISRLPITQAEVIRIPELADPRGMVNYEPRSITRCVIGTADSFAVYVTHFGLHEREAERAVSTVRAALEEEKLPFVLMGDLNLEPDSPILDPLYNELRSTDELMPENERETYPSDAPVRKIDYIFTAQNVNPLSAKVIRKVASDHCPIVAEIEI